MTLLTEMICLPGSLLQLICSYLIESEESLFRRIQSLSYRNREHPTLEVYTIADRKGQVNLLFQQKKPNSGRRAVALQTLGSTGHMSWSPYGSLFELVWGVLEDSKRWNRIVIQFDESIRRQVTFAHSLKIHHMLIGKQKVLIPY
jgi:hypothetical protein